MDVSKNDGAGKFGALSWRPLPCEKGEIAGQVIAVVDNKPVAIVEIWGLTPAALVTTLRGLANEITARQGGVLTPS